MLPGADATRMTAAQTGHAELRRALHAAARWYVQLQDESNAGTQEALAQWLKVSPLHRQAWQEVTTTMAPLGELPAQLAAPLLRGAAQSRRQLLRRLAAVAVVAPTPWLAWRQLPWQTWSSDHRTAIGERRQLTLSDGSLLALATDSAADVRFSATRRAVHLHRGEILIETAPDPQPISRPFVVVTTHGSVTALGTRFEVGLTSSSTQVTVLAARVRAAPIGGATPVEVEAGQRLIFDSDGCDSPLPADPSAGSWVGGSLIVVDMPLGQLADELARYRVGMLSCEPDIAGLRVSGAFPLDDTDRALRVLVDAFPLRLQRMTRYWVRIVAA